MNQKQDMIDTEETMLPEPDAALLPYMEKLYPLTFALKQHKPWKTIYEYEAFAVRLPDGTPACCLLTGMEGDFISLSVYSGETGWNNIHKFWETPDGLDKTQENYQELMMSQSCLQVVFCCKDDLAAAEVESLRRYAKEIGWDWRLLASLAYTESNFNPNVVSWAGAKGLMQLMPATSRLMGVPPGKEQDPEESIKAAVKYIANMQRTFSKVTDKEEQAKFILAAYNCGIGHVTDAMALAEKYGRNRYLWEHHVAHYMLLKSNKEYYQDPVCKNGYLRGSDTYEFVREILARAELYKRKIKK